MRKQFLILMLMALLPLAGWAAEPLSSAKVSVANVTYGTAALVPADDFLANWDAQMEYGVDVLWDGKIYSNQACTAVVADLATANAGTYYVKFTGGRYYEGTKVCEFKVLKAPLYVSILGEITGEGTDESPYTGGNLLTTYLVPFDITGLEIEDVEGLVNNEQFDDVVSGSLTGITVEETDANATAASTAENVTQLANKQAYQATLAGFTSTNYELVCVDKFYIKQKDISDGDGLTFLLNPKFATYNGKIRDAAYTITYAGQTLTQATRIQAGDNAGQIDKANDFSVSYKVATLDADGKITGVTGDAITNPVNANVYATQIVASENGNFAGTYPAEEAITTTSVYGNDPFVWTIKQAGLTIIALNQTKVYDTNTKLPHIYNGHFDANATEEAIAAQTAENDLAVQILWPYGMNENGEEATNIKRAVTISIPDNTAADVNDAIVISPSVGDLELANYDLNLVTGIFSITKRNLTITASDATKLYTASANPAFGVAVYDGYEFELSNEERAGEDGGENLLNELRKDIYKGHGNTAGTLQTPAARTFLKANSGNPASRGAGLTVGLVNPAPTTVGVHENALVVNYSPVGLINNYNVTKVAGTFTISGGKIYITALKQEKNYGAADPSWTPVKGTNYRIDGLIGADANADVTGLVLTREEGEAIGSYRITPSGAVAPAGYEDIVYADGEFVIKPRPITITVQPQTMKDGAKVSTLNKTAYTIDNTDENEGLVPGEVAAEIFTLALDADEHEGSAATFNFTSYSAETAGTRAQHLAPDPRTWRAGGDLRQERTRRGQRAGRADWREGPRHQQYRRSGQSGFLPTRRPVLADHQRPRRVPAHRGIHLRAKA